MNKTIDSEIIEKHAIIAGRIYTLKEKYEKRAKSLKMIIGFKEHTLPVIYYEGRLEQIEESLKDLEELVK